MRAEERKGKESKVDSSTTRNNTNNKSLASQLWIACPGRMSWMMQMLSMSRCAANFHPSHRYRIFLSTSLIHPYTEQVDKGRGGSQEARNSIIGLRSPIFSCQQLYLAYVKASLLQVAALLALTTFSLLLQIIVWIDRTQVRSTHANN